jgi:hypothetical protein
VSLGELEKRLEREPDNLGLRVTVAGMLRQVGRMEEAVALYRSVAIAYRDQGRLQQAIAVCRSILEIAPGDQASHDLVVELGSPRRASAPDTPLPPPLPYHVADPSGPADRISQSEVLEDLDTKPRPRASSQSGLAEAARRIIPEIRDGAEIRPEIDDEATQPRKRLLAEDDDPTMG